MSSPLELKSKRVRMPDGSPVLVIELHGKIDATTAMIFEEKFDQFLALGDQQIILICAGLEYINSTGMGVLIKVVDRLGSQDGALELAGVTPKSRMVFQMLGLENFFVMHADERAALKAMLARRKESPPPADPVAAKPEAAAPPGGSPRDRGYPVRFSCSQCGKRLSIADVGYYRCPQCGVFYSAAEAGKVKAYLSQAPRRVELALPLTTEFIETLRQAGRTLAEQSAYPNDKVEAIEQALDEACSVAIHQGGAATDRLEAFFVADQREFIAAIKTAGAPFQMESQEPMTRMSLSILKSVTDELQVFDLSGGGQILKLTKRR